MRNFKKNLIACLAFASLAGCASVKVADNVKLISFAEKGSDKNTKSMGTVAAKDCTWYVLGHALGMAPTVSKAFENTENQMEESLPLQQNKKVGAEGRISFIRNVSVEPSGFSAWIVGRSCINVTGVGYQ